MLARVLKMGAEKTFEIISFNPHDPICIFFRPKSHLRVHRLKFKNSAKMENPKKYSVVFNVLSDRSDFHLPRFDWSRAPSRGHQFGNLS